MDISDVPLDTIDLHNLAITFSKKRSKGWN